MSKVRFNLNRHKSAGHYIRLVFRYDGQKLVYYPGTEIQEADWNAKAQRVRPTAPNHRQINQRLKTIADKVEAIYLEHHAAGLPLSPARFRQLLDEFWKGRTLPAAGQVELLHFLQQLTEERKASPNYKPNSIKAYTTLSSILQAYAKARRVALTFDYIDLDFHGDFLAWMNGKGYAPNTILKRIKTLKTLMGEAVDRNLTQNHAWRSARFTAKGEDVDKIYLTEVEVEALRRVDLSGRPGLARVRDLFLIGCYTGLRFSDFVHIQRANVVEVEGVTMLRMRTGKTSAVVAVPLFAAALEILERYDYAPPAVVNQVLNRQIKEVGRLAGIDTPVLSEVRRAPLVVVLKPDFSGPDTAVERGS